jgi:hypothetical protein
LLTRCYSGDPIKEDEMGMACGTYEGKRYGVLAGKPEGKRPLERPDVDGRIILK